MSSIKKFAWSGAAVVLAAVLMLGIMVPQAKASTTVSGGATTISVAPTVVTTTGPGAYAALASNIVFAGNTTGDFPTGTISLAAPSGWEWNGAIAADTVAAGTALVVTSPVTYTSGTGAACVTNCANMVITITTAGTTSALTLTVGGVTKPQMRAKGNSTATGTVTISALSTAALAGLPAGTAVTTITATVPASGVAARINLVMTANATACGATNPVTAISSTVPGFPADGSTGAQLCASVIDAAGMPVAGVPVTFTVSVGYVSTGTGKSTNAFTSSVGNATTNYRGAGNVATTDTAVASMPSLNLVATPVTITLNAPTGTTASKITIQSPAVLGLAPLITNTSPAYSSPTTATNVALQVTDANGLGVNAQSVQLTVDRGGLVANAAFAAFANNQTALQAGCTGTPARSIIVTTVGTDLLSPGGAVTPGAADFVVCTNQTDAPGKVTLTAQNITTTMPNATLTLAQAGRPAKINIKVDGSTITATVVDAAGNPVADGTPVTFTISTNVGAVSSGCTTTTNGVATTVVALAGATGNVLVSTNWNETGVVATGSTCAAAGSQNLAVNVSLPSGSTAGTGSGGATTPPATTPPAAGSGTLTSGSVPAAGGFGLIVFGGGTTAQLLTASKCPSATAAFFATTPAGAFVVWVPGTNIAVVNADFLAMFPNGNIPANTPLIGKCV